jgi:energy-converting hydrogenase Eha subunit H
MREMEEGRKRVLAIVAGILVARHLKTADLFDS